MVDIGDPDGPRVLTTVASRGVTVRRDGVYHSGARQISISGSIGLIADGDGGLHVLDVSDPRGPLHLARFPEDRYAAPVYTYGVFVPISDARFAYVADGHAGLQIIDIRVPHLPEFVATAPLPCSRVAVWHTWAVVAGESGWVHVLDVSTPEAPHHVGAYFAGGTVRAVAVSEGQAFVAAEGTGVHVLALGEWEL